MTNFYDDEYKKTNTKIPDSVCKDRKCLKHTMDNISNIVHIHVFERLMEVDTKHSADSTKHYFTFSFLFCKDFKGYGNS